MALFLSGHKDSNLGPPAPKAGALPGCATPRKWCVCVRVSAVEPGFEPGVPLPVRQFSKLVDSATLPLHLTKNGAVLLSISVFCQATAKIQASLRIPNNF